MGNKRYVPLRLSANIICLMRNMHYVQARRLVERWGEGGWGFGKTIWVELTTNREDIIGGGCGRGLCPLPPTRGYGER